MAEDFLLEDAIAEFRGLPDFLQTTKVAERWLCETVVRLRLKQCGREEVAWLLGVPVHTINEALPGSAAGSLIGEALSDLGFLPRGSGCIIQGCRSLAHLNGRRCALVQDLKDGATHAMVIVAGGTEEELGAGDPSNTIGIARKNLELACSPDDIESTEGFPSMSLAPEATPESPRRKPEDYLGQKRDAPLPEHLTGKPAMQWLASAAGRLAESKECGREEVAYLLGLAAKSLNGAALSPSVAAEDVGQFLTELTFVPKRAECSVEGSNSRADLNGRKAHLLEECLDSQTHARICVGELNEELQIHRKNLRLASLPGEGDALCESEQKAKDFAAQKAKEEEDRLAWEKEQAEQEGQQKAAQAQEAAARAADDEARQKDEAAKQAAEAEEAEAAGKLATQEAAERQAKEEREKEERERLIQEEVDRKVKEELAQRAAQEPAPSPAMQLPEAPKPPGPLEPRPAGAAGVAETPAASAGGLWSWLPPLGCNTCCENKAGDMLVGDTPRVTNYATSPDNDEVHPSLGGSGSPAVVALKVEAEGLADRPAPAPEAPADATDATADEAAAVPASPAGAPAGTAPRPAPPVAAATKPPANGQVRKRSSGGLLSCLCGKVPPEDAGGADAPKAAATVTDELRTLVQLKAEGLLTEAEFTTAKAKLLTA